MKKIYILLATVFLGCMGYGLAQTGASFSGGILEKQTLVVHTIERPPFVFYKDNELTGFSIELRKEIQARGGFDSQFVVATIFSDMIASVRDKETDLAIANISITSEREKYIDFSYPIFDSGLRMLTRKESSDTGTYMGRTKQHISLAILVLLGLYSIVLLAGYVQKIKEENTIKKLRGLLLVVCVLMPTVFVGSTLQRSLKSTASGSVYRYQDINTQGFRLGVASGTTMSRYFDKKGVPYTSYPDYQQTLEALEGGYIDITVGDAPVVDWYAHNTGKDRVQTIGKIFAPDKLAIAFQEESLLVEDINEILLEIIEDGTYATLKEKYFGK